MQDSRSGSSVLSVGLDLPCPDGLKLSDDRTTMVHMLDIMKRSTTHQKPPESGDGCLIVPAQHVSSIVSLADKYDVTNLVHQIQSLTIVKTLELSGVNQTLDALDWSFKFKDTWLVKHILGQGKLGDPAQWARNITDSLGYNVWYNLVTAYPRDCPTPSAAASKWNQTTKKVLWESLM